MKSWPSFSRNVIILPDFSIFAVVGTFKVQSSGFRSVPSSSRMAPFLKTRSMFEPAAYRNRVPLNLNPSSFDDAVRNANLSNEKRRAVAFR
jgi:hypothetical protein